MAGRNSPKRLYAASTLLLGFAFLCVVAATLRWWLEPLTALLAFVFLGLAPPMFFTVIGTLVLDPGKTTGGGIIDSESAPYVDRFGAGALPLCLAALVFTALTATWFVEDVRVMAVNALAKRHVEVPARTFADPSAEVALAACRSFADRGATRPIGVGLAQLKLGREELVDCLISLPGTRFENKLLLTEWTADLYRTPSDDRACRLTNRIRTIARHDPDLAPTALLEIAIAGGTPAARFCSAQSLGALAVHNGVEPAALLPLPEDAQQVEARMHADIIVKQAFDDASNAPLTQVANWDGAAQRNWSVQFACASPSVQLELDQWLSDRCSTSLPFQALCGQTEFGDDASICRVAHTEATARAYRAAEMGIRNAIRKNALDRFAHEILFGPPAKEKEDALPEWSAKSSRILDLMKKYNTSKNKTDLWVSLVSVQNDDIDVKKLRKQIEKAGLGGPEENLLELFEITDKKTDK